jgi:hypothetical protein
MRPTAIRMAPAISVVKSGIMRHPPPLNQSALCSQFASVLRYPSNPEANAKTPTKLVNMVSSIFKTEPFNIKEGSKTNIKGTI